MNTIILLLFLILSLGLYEQFNRKISANIMIIMVVLIIFIYKPDSLYEFITLFYDTNMKNPIKPTFTLKRKPTRRSVGESIKKMVAASQHWNCSVCGMMLNASYEIDHTIPLYRGGSNHISNLTAMCRNCHGNKTLSDKLLY